MVPSVTLPLNIAALVTIRPVVAAPNVLVPVIVSAYPLDTTGVVVVKSDHNMFSVVMLTAPVKLLTVVTGAFAGTCHSAVPDVALVPVNVTGPTTVWLLLTV